MPEGTVAVKIEVQLVQRSRTGMDQTDSRVRLSVRQSCQSGSWPAASHRSLSVTGRFEVSRTLLAQGSRLQRSRPS